MSTALTAPSSYRMNVYEAINQVQLAMSRDGIVKARKNEQQGYAFRGIDDMYNALSIPLASVGLCIIPRFKNRIVTERTTQKGGVLFYVVVEGEFDLIGPDGSKHTALAFGEAMDSADKATNKAMSAAFKYMCMQIFCIPTEGDNDADSTTHILQARADAVAQRRISELSVAQPGIRGVTGNAPDAMAPSTRVIEGPPATDPNIIIELANSLDVPQQTPVSDGANAPSLSANSKGGGVEKPTRKRGAISFAALKQWGEIKKEIVALTGNTDLYYQALSAGGYQHADEIKTPADAAKIWKALKAITAEVGRAKQDKATLLEAETHALRLGPYAFQAALGRHLLQSVDEVLTLGGDELDALLRELRETA